MNMMGTPGDSSKYSYGGGRIVIQAGIMNHSGQLVSNGFPIV